MVAQASDRAVMRMLREQPFVRRQGADGEVEHHLAEDSVAVSALHTTARITAKGRGVPDPQLHLHYLLIGALDASPDAGAGLQGAGRLPGRAGGGGQRAP